MRPYRISAILMLLVVFVTRAGAQELSLEIERPVLGPGDVIAIRVTLGNPTPSEISGILDYGITRDVGMPGDSAFRRHREPLNLAPGATIERTKTFEVLAAMSPGGYLADFVVLDVEGVQLVGEAVFFQIEGTLRPLEILLFAADPDDERRTVFVLGEQVCLGFEASPEEVEVVAAITFPDDSQLEERLPFCLPADRPGTYSVEAKASCEECKPIMVDMRFAVLEEDVEIPMRH